MEQLGLAGGQLSARSPQANGTYSPKDSWLPGFNLTRKKGQGRTEVISYRFTDAENKAQTLPTLGQLTVIMTVTAAAVSWQSVLQQDASQMLLRRSPFKLLKVCMHSPTSQLR